MTAKHLEHMLQRRKKCGNFRTLQVIQNCIDFSSNDILGLSRSQDFARNVFKEQKKQKTLLNGLGSTGSRLLTGNSEYAMKLERSIAKYHGYEKGILFSCGYMANLGLISTIGKSKSIIFFDSAIHASVRDGISLSQAQAYSFRHNDPHHLESRLKNCTTKEDRYICIESIYSTDGSIAPLEEIVHLSKQYDAHLIVDEAHAIGVWGHNGKGLVESHDTFAKVITFSKALGTHGAIVLGNSLLKDALINFATPYMYSTALSLQNLCAIKCAYAEFPKLDNERTHVRNLIAIFTNFTSTTHIQPIPIQGKDIQALVTKLNEKGFDVRALKSPTVQRGHEVLRICLHAFNTSNEVHALVAELSRIL